MDTFIEENNLSEDHGMIVESKIGSFVYNEMNKCGCRFSYI